MSTDTNLQRIPGTRRGRFFVATDHGSRTPRGRHRLHGADRRRVRHRQGSAGAPDPSREPAREARNFVAVNCAAIPENMLEAMLFGYEKGSFTGAHASHAGKFEQAQGGTLLLDEITEMPLALAGEAAARAAGKGSRAPRRHRARSRSTCACSPPPTATCAAKWPPAASAKISITASTYSRSRSPVARSPRRHPAARDPSARSSVRAPATAFPRCRPTWRICCSPIPGPATCASSTTCCSARWCSSKARVIEAAAHPVREAALTRRHRPTQRLADAAADARTRRARRHPRGAARRARQPPRSGREARDQPAHAALQARAHPQLGHRSSCGLITEATRAGDHT